MSRLEAFKQLTPIAYRIAHSYKRRLPLHEHTDDLVNVALMGVWEAVLRRHNDSMESLTALAVIRAQGAIIDYLRSKDWATRHSRKIGKPAKMLYLHEDSLSESFIPSLVTSTTPEDEAVDNQASAQRSQALELGLAALGARERYIVRRLLAGAAQVEIAKELKVSGPRISQILTRALPKLKAVVRQALSHRKL
jgi:RNA polymerase sigma factor (sigma-70 family)